MRKRNFLLLLSFSLMLALTGCFETTEETEIHEDGGGFLRTTNDMSTMLEAAKQMDPNSAEKMDDEKMDTTMSLATQVDSVKGLSPQEKELMKNGTIHIAMNLGENKFVTTLTFPFTSIEQLVQVQQLSNKVSLQAIQNQMDKNQLGSADPAGEDPPVSSFDDYFINTSSSHLLVKTLNKERYAKADSDQFLAGLKESSSMGVSFSTTYVINLPRPAIKAEGKGVELSADKKKITIKVNIDDFFEDPSKLEYRIEY